MTASHKPVDGATMTVAQARAVVGDAEADRIAALPVEPLPAHVRARLVPILLAALARRADASTDAAA